MTMATMMTMVVLYENSRTNCDDDDDDDDVNDDDDDDDDDDFIREFPYELR